MEISYRVSEAEYLTAWKLRKNTSSRAVRKTVFFWVFILICLMLLWAVVSRPAHLPKETHNTVVTQHHETKPASASNPRAVLLNVVPFLALMGIWVFLMFFRVPMQLRRAYQKDPMMQGQFTVDIEPASITIRNTAGTLFQGGWNIYEGWREQKGVIVLFLRNGAASILSLGGLTDYQRNEVLSILNVALPKK